MIQNSHYGLKDHETKYRNRYLDLLINQDSKETFITRSKIISMIRQKLLDNDFLEVETPIIGTKYGGANARPFKTYHHDLETEMFMRVAPEIYLKTLIIGGYNKVFEIGKNFRNEGIDQTHNPEFTACEYYWAYQDFYDQMDFSEQLLTEIVLKIKGSLKFQITD